MNYSFKAGINLSVRVICMNCCTVLYIILSEAIVNQVKLENTVIINIYRNNKSINNVGDAADDAVQKCNDGSNHRCENWLNHRKTNWEWKRQELSAGQLCMAEQSHSNE